MLTFTVEELAKALNRNQQVLYRWFAANMFPRPHGNGRNRAQQQSVGLHQGRSRSGVARIFPTPDRKVNIIGNVTLRLVTASFAAIYSARADLAAKGGGGMTK
jgi:hypothetical protein